MRSSAIEEADSEAALLSVEQTLLVTGRLHRVLRPFVLRRLKETVAAELAPKVQATRGCRNDVTRRNTCQRAEPMGLPFWCHFLAVGVAQRGKAPADCSQ